MHRLRTLLGLCLLVAAGCSKSGQPEPAKQEKTESPPAEPLVLAVQWPVDRRVVNQFEWVQKLETFYPGVPEPLMTEMTVTQSYSLTVVKDLGEGRCELRLELGPLQMAAQRKGRLWFEYDSTSESAKDPSNAVASALGRVPGQVFSVQLNGSGQVENITGLQEFLAAVNKDAPHQARSVLDGLLGERSFKQLVELGRALPSDPVKRGDAWPAKMEFSLGPLGEVTLNATNSFVAWEPRHGQLCALLVATGVFGDARGPFPGATSIEGGESKGQMWLEPKAGTLMESELKQTMLQVMKPGGNTPGQLTITNRIEQQFHVRLTEVSQVP